MINMHLLRSFRKNLKALKIQKKQYEQELMRLRVEIQEYTLAIDWIKRNITREMKNKEISAAMRNYASLRTKNKRRDSK